jgi:DNA (cytosine-5)-methyltransferase 1
MTPHTSYVTVTDQFCGAGGSSIGAVGAGAELRLALNHWPLAIETHNTNFPDADHDCTDISACDPRRYPSTDILLTSPECTNHSLAKGKMRKWQAQLDMFGKMQIDPAEERSRATMWDVVRFAEHHHYRIIVVENVVEARWWVPFPAWLQAMELLGYHHKAVYLNSMFAHPTPQSRDRMYVVFWRKSLRAPNLDIRPRAHCPRCSCDVESVQSWKNPQKPWGKYGQQYVYRCPECAGEVVPYYFAAFNAIDWSLPAPRIGDRKRPLKEKTLKRIRVGLEKFGRQPVLVDYVHTARGDRHQDMVWNTARPMRTQLGIHTQALVTPPPFIVQTAHPDGDGTVKQWPIERALPTQSARAELGMVLPPLVVPLEHGDNQARPVTEAMPTQTTAQGSGLLVPPYLVDLRGENAPRETTDPLSTVCGSGNHHGVVVPFLSSYYGTGDGSPIEDPVPTVPTRDRHALVLAPFIVSYYTRLTGQQAAVSGLDEPAPTVPGRAVHYLAQPGETPAVEDCGFRMLQPHEIGAAMAFPSSYKVLGTQREQVKQYGNAVTPPVMGVLVRRCLDVLH